MSVTKSRDQSGGRPRRTSRTRTRWPTSNWRLFTVLNDARTGFSIPSRRSSKVYDSAMGISAGVRMPRSAPTGCWV
jgi:hypothetical protein